MVRFTAILAIATATATAAAARSGGAPALGLRAAFAPSAAPLRRGPRLLRSSPSPSAPPAPPDPEPEAAPPPAAPLVPVAPIIAQVHAAGEDREAVASILDANADTLADAWPTNAFAEALEDKPRARAGAVVAGFAQAQHRNRLQRDVQALLTAAATGGPGGLDAAVAAVRARHAQLLAHLDALVEALEARALEPPGGGGESGGAAAAAADAGGGGGGPDTGPAAAQLLSVLRERIKADSMPDADVLKALAAALRLDDYGASEVLRALDSDARGRMVARAEAAAAAYAEAEEEDQARNLRRVVELAQRITG